MQHLSTCKEFLITLGVDSVVVFEVKHSLLYMFKKYIPYSGNLNSFIFKNCGSFLKRIQVFCTPVFLKLILCGLLVCVRVCVYVCLCPCPRLLITSDMVWLVMDLI